MVPTTAPHTFTSHLAVDITAPPQSAMDDAPDRRARRPARPGSNSKMAAVAASMPDENSENASGNAGVRAAARPAPPGGGRPARPSGGGRRPAGARPPLKRSDRSPRAGSLVDVAKSIDNDADKGGTLERRTSSLKDVARDLEEQREEVRKALTLVDAAALRGLVGTLTRCVRNRWDSRSNCRCNASRRFL